MDFLALVAQVHEQNNIHGVPAKLLSFDPGHTTGWAYFELAQLVYSGQIDTQDITKTTTEIDRMVRIYEPTAIVLEDYRIYRWKMKEHVGSDMLTTRVIGSIETFAVMNQIPLFKQSAQVAKNFCTDKKLKAWDMYNKNEKHARDAIRHGCYFLIFGPNAQSDKDYFRDTTTIPR